MPSYSMNPATKRMWAASDANLPGSGAALEQWALGEIQKAAAAGQLDLGNQVQISSFLGSLGITPEKGGGRFLYNKLTGPQSPLAGMKARVGSAGPAMSGGMESGMGPRANSYSEGGMSSLSPTEMGRRALQGRYGTAGTLGSIGTPRPNAYSDFGGSGDSWEEFGGY